MGWRFPGSGQWRRPTSAGCRGRRPQSCGARVRCRGRSGRAVGRAPCRVTAAAGRGSWKVPSRNIEKRASARCAARRDGLGVVIAGGDSLVVVGPGRRVGQGGRRGQEDDRWTPARTTNPDRSRPPMPGPRRCGSAASWGLARRSRNHSMSRSPRCAPLLCLWRWAAEGRGWAGLLSMPRNGGMRWVQCRRDR